MRTLLLTLLAILTLSSCSGSGGMTDDDDDIRVPEGFRFVWSEEFNGTSIDTDTWTHWVTGNPYNNELQYYTNHRKNSYVEDGMLHLVAYKEGYTGPDGTRQYTSARINSRGNADFKYGRFEIRAKMPIGKGIWPAIWMMPTDAVHGGWPRSGEIDIMEYLGHDPDTVHGTLHYATSAGNHTSSGDSYSLDDGTFHDDFHVFAIEWKEGEIEWFVDGYQVQRQNSWQTRGVAYPAPFNERFHFILNLAVGGNWPGSPNASTVFPQEMVVDYVRVFERIEE